MPEKVTSSEPSNFDHYPWVTGAGFMQAAGLDVRWFEMYGTMYNCDPVVDRTAREITYQEFSVLFLQNLIWLLQTYELGSLKRIAIIDITNIAGSVFERGISQEENPDLPPQEGVSLSQVGIRTDELQAGFAALGAMVEQDKQRLTRLYPFILNDVQSVLEKYPEKPLVIFVPAFLRDNSPLMDVLRKIGHDTRTQIVFMREEHKAFDGFVDL